MAKALPLPWPVLAARHGSGVSCGEADTGAGFASAANARACGVAIEPTPPPGQSVAAPQLATEAVPAHSHATCKLRSLLPRISQLVRDQISGISISSQKAAL